MKGLRGHPGLQGMPGPSVSVQNSHLKTKRNQSLRCWQRTSSVFSHPQGPAGDSGPAGPNGLSGPRVSGIQKSQKRTFEGKKSTNCTKIKSEHNFFPLLKSTTYFVVYNYMRWCATPSGS